MTSDPPWGVTSPWHPVSSGGFGEVRYRSGWRQRKKARPIIVVCLGLRGVAEVSRKRSYDILSYANRNPAEVLVGRPRLSASGVPHTCSSRCVVKFSISMVNRTLKIRNRYSTVVIICMVLIFFVRCNICLFQEQRVRDVVSHYCQFLLYIIF